MNNLSNHLIKLQLPEFNVFYGDAFNLAKSVGYSEHFKFLEKDMLGKEKAI